MSYQQAKPPIVTAIRNDTPLPHIPIGGGVRDKTLHDASTSAHRVDLPSVLQRTVVSDYYTQVADRFLDNADFSRLNGVNLSHPDPTILYHRNESDVARSIEQSINREVGLIIVGGHAPGTLEIDSTTQAWKKIEIHNREPFEPASVITIPDWKAKCTLTAPGKEPVQSTLVQEYKDIGLVVVDQLARECDMSFDRWTAVEAENRKKARELSDRIVMANNQGTVPDFIGLHSGVRSVMTPQNREIVNTLGRKYANPFTQDVATTLHQLTNYVVKEDAPYAILGDYRSLAIFEYTEMKEFPKVDEVSRLRRGPGNKVRVLLLNNESHKIRRNVLGAWLKGIGSESGEAWMKSTGSVQNEDTA
ncbi:hypothetical protein BDP55DRAFT_717038 [Colletotrichum godetiae]|uniref:Uncharacterized protein n=1 Tax=Colletotrichum godetiae TaxID=1209918 RepID=A0AAJ0AK18_9PEZI|nr:uncharacterized protein BDP55DRAFT_717038 [Colletotrichum godetiae]KAK1673817.1 hypothetical protein BDP55DRAFT_717038 [Colletotrichum godetiae]